MYRGKYEKASTPPAQRKPAAPKEETTPKSPAPAPKDPAPARSTHNAPARRTPPAKKKGRKKKKPATKGTVIFYTIFLVFVLAFFIGMVILLNWLKGWLVDFEASQPSHKSQEVYSTYFADPDWEQLYEIGELKGGSFGDAASYAAYMEELTADHSFVMVETSAGMTGKKYIIRADRGDDGYFDVADFTLVEQNAGTDDAQWQLDKISLYVPGSEQPTVDPTYGYTFIIDPANTVTVDGLVLDESHVIQTTTTAAEEYLPEGIHGYRAYTLYLGGLTEEAKQITITDPSGATVECAYDEATRTYVQPLVVSPEIPDEARDATIAAGTAYCKFMIKKISKSDLKQWFDPNSEIFPLLTPDAFLQSFVKYEIGAPDLTHYYRYSDDLYSIRFSTNVVLTRKNGDVKDYPVDITFFLEKQGKSWKVVDMTNVEVQKQITQVRVTYMVDDEVLSTVMVDQTAIHLTLPAVTVPEGQTFQGWATKTQAENGGITYNLLFQPAPEGGMQALPADYELAPLTLYAVFQEAA